MIINRESLPKSLEEYEIKRLLKTHDKESLSKVVNHNLRLVLHIVRKFSDSEIYEEEEFFQIGTIGLIKATNTFNIEKEIKFATYASRCIENEILMYLRKKSNKNALECSSFQEAITIDSEGHELTIESIYSDDTDIEEQYLKKEKVDLLHKIIKEYLKKDEQKIITMYYGLFGTQEYTQSQIGEILNITQSHISRKLSRINKKIKEEMEKCYIPKNNPKTLVAVPKKTCTIPKKITVDLSQKLVFLTKEELEHLKYISKNPLTIEQLNRLPALSTFMIVLLAGYTGQFYSINYIKEYFNISMAEVIIVLKETIKITKIFAEQNKSESPKNPHIKKRKKQEQKLHKIS